MTEPADDNPVRRSNPEIGLRRKRRLISESGPKFWPDGRPVVLGRPGDDGRRTKYVRDADGLIPFPGFDEFGELLCPVSPAAAVPWHFFGS